MNGSEGLISARMDPVSCNGYSHSQEVPWAIRQRFPCTSYLVLLVFIPRVRSRIFVVFKRSKSSHFVGYLVMLCVYIITLFASAVKRISHERVRKMIKSEAFLMCTTAQED